jgi:hypothetical protein
MTELELELARRTWEYRPVDPDAGEDARWDDIITSLQDREPAAAFVIACLLCLTGTHTPACLHYGVCPRNDPRNKGWRCRRARNEDGSVSIWAEYPGEHGEFPA